MKNSKITEAQYIQEIKVWKKSSEIHAKKAIEQYKNILKNIEDFQFEKTRNDAILNYLSDTIIVLDHEQCISIFNEAACQLVNVSAQDIIGKHIDKLPYELYTLIDKYLSSGEYEEILHFREKYFSIEIKDTKIGTHIYKVILLSDISNLMALQLLLEKEKASLEDKVNSRTQELQEEVIHKNKVHEKLEYLVLTDFLTELPNRKAFNSKLETLMKKNVSSDKHKFCLFFIDLDGFKTVNDTFGHDVGDKLLIKLSKLMKETIRNNDFIARLAGDEFVLLLDNVTDKIIVQHIAHKLLNITKKQIVLENGKKIAISFSIGILMNPAKGLDTSTILSMADRAMYEVKDNGKNSYMFFNEDMLEDFEQKIDVFKRLDDALKNNEFYLNYQPICDIEGNILSCEALSRWKYKGKNISPAKFIPIIEEKGLIVAFTYKLIDNIFMSFLEENFTIPSVSINLSVFQFYDSNLISYLEEMKKLFPKNISRVCFEITESIFTKDPNMILEKLSIIRNLGFKIYIDDFGTGYSSFDYIRKYPVDVLKIDKVFVDEITTDERQYKLLKGMISLASSLDIDVVIEGVETQEQCNLIKLLNTEVKIQGYLFSKPLNQDELIELIGK
ncbi:MAG: diguanylate cyclase (GGDEF)-like protein [Sulfurimonas sp.]|jgi:diguanylate cyclase (GGDEF)-like protein|uniref:EAL domain-containing protein n=1 Tax=Sulfurimonas sp. TaxID=2022749 RepID=UPI0039E5B904